jgi:hypothetical protein
MEIPDETFLFLFFPFPYKPWEMCRTPRCPTNRAKFHVILTNHETKHMYRSGGKWSDWWKNLASNQWTLNNNTVCPVEVYYTLYIMQCPDLSFACYQGRLMSLRFGTAPKFAKRGTMTPWSIFLHLKILKSAPKCPKLIPEIIKSMHQKYGSGALKIAWKN